jgi:hypothetical protein
LSLSEEAEALHGTPGRIRSGAELRDLGIDVHGLDPSLWRVEADEVRRFDLDEVKLYVLGLAHVRR